MQNEPGKKMSNMSKLNDTHAPIDPVIMQITTIKVKNNLTWRFVKKERIKIVAGSENRLVRIIVLTNAVTMLLWYWLVITD